MYNILNDSKNRSIIVKVFKSIIENILMKYGLKFVKTEIG